MKGIILAGGLGSRLYPVTKGISKQLLPVYDKPMIYYPLSVLMLAGIKNILIITTPEDKSSFKRLLGDGSSYGVSLSYEIQNEPGGLAEAFLIGESFIGTDSVCLALGDNIFWGQGFSPMLQNVVTRNIGATIFSYQVRDPERFGIVELDIDNNPISIQEKPSKPKSKHAITGLYFYDNEVVSIAKSIKPSSRGELEISSINQIYLDKEILNVEMLGRGFAWLDTGTHDSLLQASMFVETIEKRQGFKVACLEEIALENKWITKEKISSIINEMPINSYSLYLSELIKNKI